MSKHGKQMDVLMTGPDDETLTPLLALLEQYGLAATQGWIERTPHPADKFPMPWDYKAAYVVSFFMPHRLRGHPHFRPRLDALIFVGDED